MLKQGYDNLMESNPNKTTEIGHFETESSAYKKFLESVLTIC